MRHVLLGLVPKGVKYPFFWCGGVCIEVVPLEKCLVNNRHARDGDDWNLQCVRR